MKRQKKIIDFMTFLITFVFSLALLYPLFWMLMTSFKTEASIFTTTGFFPKEFTFENYVVGWNAVGRVSFGTYYKNSFIISFLCVLGNLLSCSFAAYAIARMKFKFRSIIFGAILLTMMLPQHATLVPQYVYFNKIGWKDSILPIVVPKFLAIDGFFIYLIIQFIRGIPKELDEAAIVDGCNRYTLFFRIIVPLTVPALITTFIFTFLWSWNNFLTQMLYLNTITKYTVTLGLKGFIDNMAQSQYGALYAMTTLSIVPMLVIFVFFQRYLVDGIVSSGIKG